MNIAVLGKRVRDDYQQPQDQQWPVSNGSAHTAYGAPPPPGQTPVSMFIPSSKCGLIIGKKGETISTIRATYNVHIELVVNKMGPASEVKLTGPAASVDSAKKDILGRIAASNVNTDALAPGLAKKTITIPNKFVGIVIGRAGDKIRQLTSMTGCKIYIHPDETKTGTPGFEVRQIDFTGSEAQVKHADDEIEKLMDHARQTENGGPGGNGSSSGASITEQMPCPHNLAGMVIGKGGEKIRRLQAEHGARVSIAQEAVNGVRTVTITGDPIKVRSTVSALIDIIEGAKMGGNPGPMGHGRGPRGPPRGPPMHQPYYNPYGGAGAGAGYSPYGAPPPAQPYGRYPQQPHQHPQHQQHHQHQQHQQPQQPQQHQQHQQQGYAPYGAPAQQPYYAQPPSHTPAPAHGAAPVAAAAPTHSPAVAHQNYYGNTAAYQQPPSATSAAAAVPAPYQQAQKPYYPPQGESQDYYSAQRDAGAKRQRTL